jgi:hypothetical protein
MLEDDDEPVTDYWCSKCGEIGGDSKIGPYDGCQYANPKGGKHDTAGGEA